MNEFGFALKESSNHQSYKMNFIDGISSLINFQKLKEQQRQAIMHLIIFIFLILSGIFFYKKKLDWKDLKNTDSINEYLKKQKSTSFYDKLLKYLIHLFLAVQLWFLYKPSDTDKTVSMLIDILKSKTIINEELYSKIRELKPYHL
tara:strand:+ start:1217 stop:1654 length:438 start_codon:yes stop_codon:yes gene_type:complete